MMSTSARGDVGLGAHTHTHSTFVALRFIILPRARDRRVITSLPCSARVNSARMCVNEIFKEENIFAKICTECAHAQIQFLRIFFRENEMDYERHIYIYIHI